MPAIAQLGIDVPKTNPLVEGGKSLACDLAKMGAGAIAEALGQGWYKAIDLADGAAETAGGSLIKCP